MARFLTAPSMRVWLQAVTMSVMSMLTGIVAMYGASCLWPGAAQRPDVSLPILIFIMAISTSAGAAVSILAARRMAGPIRAVAQAAGRIADGEKGVRVKEGNAAGEPADLIRHFNRMANAIDLYARERSVLTGGVAHELRTPLTILKGRLHGLKDGIIDPERGEADRLLGQVDHLLRLVGDMGTLALADAGRLSLVMQPVDFADVVRAAVADMRPLIASLNLSLHETYRTAPVCADPARLTQIITNLLTNAIRHAPTGSGIGIRVAVLDGCAIASVMDEGAGLASQDSLQLFTPFRRSRPHAQGRADSGMGLALCALMTEAHGGHIAGTNRTDRTGALFTISLPLVIGPSELA